MAGRTAPDLLGERQLAGYTRDAILRAVLPESERGHVTLVGARAWPRQPGNIVAIACVIDEAPRFDHGPSCDSESMRVYLAVLEPGVDGALRAVAAVGLFSGGAGASPPALEWGGNAGTDMPNALVDAAGSTTTHDWPTSWESFDFASYALGDGTTAFGLRGGWNEGYSGGGASFTSLYLFELRDGVLSCVFAAPVSMLKNIAGDWNADGTRQHDVSEAANILVVRREVHDGHRDLEMKRRGARTGDTYRWSTALSRYRLLR